MTDTDIVSAASARELLRDSFTRIIEHVGEVTDGLSDPALTYRPTPDANSIAWLIWHSARCQDVQICAMAGAEPVWTARGWEPRFGLDLPADSNGYGHTAGDVAKVVATADQLSGYYRDVHEMTLSYVDSDRFRTRACCRPTVGPTGHRECPAGQHRRRLRAAPGPGCIPAWDHSNQLVGIATWVASCLDSTNDNDV